MESNIDSVEQAAMASSNQAVYSFENNSVQDSSACSAEFQITHPMA